MRFKILHKHKHTCNKGFNSGLRYVFSRKRKENDNLRDLSNTKNHPWKYLCCHAGWSWGCWRRVQSERRRSGGHSAVRLYPLHWRSGSPERRSHHMNIGERAASLFLPKPLKMWRGWITAVKPVHVCITFWEIYTQGLGALIFLKWLCHAASKWEEINFILTDVRDSPHNVWPQLSAINRTKYIKCLFGRRLKAFGEEMLSYSWIHIQDF